MARVSTVQTTVSCKLGQTICLLLRKFSKVRAARRRPGPRQATARAASGRAVQNSKCQQLLVLTLWLISRERGWQIYSNVKSVINERKLFNYFQLLLRITRRDWFLLFTVCDCVDH